MKRDNGFRWGMRLAWAGAAYLLAQIVRAFLAGGASARW